MSGVNASTTGTTQGAHIPKSQRAKENEYESAPASGMICCCRRRIGLIAILVAVIVLVLAGIGAGLGVALGASDTGTSAIQSYEGRWTSPLFGIDCDACTLEYNVLKATTCEVDGSLDTTNGACDPSLRPSDSSACTSTEFCGTWSLPTFTNICNPCTSSFRLDTESECELPGGGKDETGTKCDPQAKPAQTSDCTTTDECTSSWTEPDFGTDCGICTRLLNVVTPPLCVRSSVVVDESECNPDTKPSEESTCDPGAYCGTWQAPVVTCNSPNARAPVCQRSSVTDLYQVVGSPVNECVDTRDNVSIMDDAFCDPDLAPAEPSCRASPFNYCSSVKMKVCVTEVTWSTLDVGQSLRIKVYKDYVSRTDYDTLIELLLVESVAETSGSVTLPTSGAGSACLVGNVVESNPYSVNMNVDVDMYVDGEFDTFTTSNAPTTPGQEDSISFGFTSTLSFEEYERFGSVLDYDYY